MSKGVNVKISGKLKQFLNEQTGPGGLYESASEYIRDLIRRDYERRESRKWRRLVDRLRPGMNAGEDEFIVFDPEEIIETAKKEKIGHAS